MRLHKMLYRLSFVMTSGAEEDVAVEEAPLFELLFEDAVVFRILLPTKVEVAASAALEVMITASPPPPLEWLPSTLRIKVDPW